MSVDAITWAYRQKVKPAAAKFVLVTIANWADQAAYCWGTQKKIAEFTGQCERAVREHLATLESAGLIRRIERRDKKGRRDDDGFLLDPEGRFGLEELIGERTPEYMDKLKANRQILPPGKPKPTGRSCQTNRQNLPNQPAESAGISNEDTTQDTTIDTNARRARDPGLAGAGDTPADGPDTTAECGNGGVSPDKPTPANAHWKAMQGELEEAFGSAWDSWIKRLIPISDDGDAVVLGAPTRFWRDHVADMGTELLQSILQRSVSVVVFNPGSLATAKRIQKKADRAAEMADRSP